jgi:hypothetical protein
VPLGAAAAGVIASLCPENFLMCDNANPEMTQILRKATKALFMYLVQSKYSKA